MPTTSPAPPTTTQGSVPTSDCKPASIPSKSEVQSRINAVLDKHPELDAGDRAFLLKTAEIESSNNPYAKNPNTSATGLFQMVDSTAATYFKKIGVEPTCENRCNVEYATEAMIRFYKGEILKYYNEFQSSGGTKMAGKQIKDTPHSAKYPSLSKAVFCYGLIHHDGIGNAVNGKDAQGVQIAKKYFA